jgi:transposase
MPVKINNMTKSLVIQKWLAGHSRDEIALECGSSGGAVSGMVARWKQSMGVEYADQLA